MKKSGGPKLSRAIGYIRKRVPSFDLPPYEGRRYEAMVPDTLDIQERIALAVNGLTGATDPEKNHLLYFRVEFRSNPPMMKHSHSDICQVKFMESLPLMRLASGSTLNEGVDPVWMSVALRLIGPDGLVYWPSLPWAKYPDFPPTGRNMFLSTRPAMNNPSRRSLLSWPKAWQSLMTPPWWKWRSSIT